VTRYSRPKVISGAEYLALAELRYQIRRFLRLSEEASRAAGLEPQQHQLLLVLKRLALLDLRPAISVVAERLQVQHHSAVVVVDVWVGRGVVGRLHVRGYGRLFLFVLTPMG
jgi:hypothetical protein